MLSLLVAAWTVEALLHLPRLGDPQISPNGATLAWVQQGEVYFSPVENVETPKVVHRGSRPRWSPDSKTLAFVAPVNGINQIYLYDPQSGSVREFTSSQAPVGAYLWTTDGRAIGYLSDPGPPPDPEVSGEYTRYSHLYLQPLDAKHARQVTAAREHVVSFALSPSGTQAVYAAQKTPRNQDSLQSDLFTVDLKTLKSKPLVVQPGRDGDPSYSPDGKWIAFHSQDGSMNYFDPRDVALIPASGGQIRYLTRGHPEDVFRNGNAFTWSSDSRSLIYTAGAGTHDVLVRQDLTSGKIDALAEGIASTASFSSDLTRAVFLKTSRSHPPEIALLSGGSVKELTHIEQDAVKHFPAFSTEVVKWKSRDGTDVEGVLWLPPTYRPGTRVPLLTELHGGPTGVTLDAFPGYSTYPVQAFLQNGFAVFSPNFRGSVNYGAAFRLKNANSQGEGDYDDVMTGIDHLIARGIADPDRLGIMGWSYGGYLTASIVTQTKRFKAASIGAPAVDWITYYGQSDGPKEVLWTYFGGTPWDVPENYTRHSPRAHLKDIRTPCLLQIGAIDINHNAEIYRALTDNHVDVVYTVYPREPHGFTEPAHIRDVMERNLNWFISRVK